MSHQNHMTIGIDNASQNGSLCILPAQASNSLSGTMVFWQGVESLMARMRHLGGLPIEAIEDWVSMLYEGSGVADPREQLAEMQRELDVVKQENHELKVLVEQLSKKSGVGLGLESSMG